MTITLGIIGGGNMGRAIIAGALRAGILAPSELMVAEIDPERRNELEELGCPVTEDAAAAADAEQVLLAVKPQSFPAVAEAVGRLGRPTVVISVMAGLRSPRIRAALGEAARVVRVMPNTPCQIGLGISAVALGEGATAGDDDLARRILGAVGEVVTVREEQMYAVTAVSGSGPAYVFLLAEAWERAAVELGIEPAIARKLVYRTIAGASGLLEQSGRRPAELRDAVTSPGGTTAAALEVMYRHELPETVVRAVAAARDRGIELDR
ncbi:MAG: pyrroline-5-carboxylate reductase [Planctomycetota bacterium]|jgi:pyrroline-5-carboxylate reductase